VRVNAINPGSILTDRLNGRILRLAEERGISTEEAARRLTDQTGVRRFGKPEEIADAVAFLASARAGYMQGTVLDVDGGQTRTL
jgi:3-oxoacyl-[acyl-carrier protein] reductase